MSEEIVHEPFMDLVPQSGWLAEYMSYTLRSEPPAVFHFFVGAAVIGAVASRNVWVDKGYYKVYPDMHIILVAPTGKCRKTSALILGINRLKKLGHPIIADKITPEALAEALACEQVIDGIRIEKDSIGTLYAPELAVFLGKQKYNEGMITLLTALFDCPDEWSTQTKHGRGKISMKNVALSFMGASTPDWLMSAIPQDAFGGGFMSRLLFISQDDTPRCYPFPTPPGDDTHLIEGLKKIQDRKGEIVFTDEGREWFEMWYVGTKKAIPEDSKMAGYHERKPDHLIRLSQILVLSEGVEKIGPNQLQQASLILNTLEREMLTTFKWLGVRTVGVDQERLIRTIRSAGGSIPYSLLVAKMIFYMDIMTFRRCLETLEVSKIVSLVEDKYILHEERLQNL